MSWPNVSPTYRFVSCLFAQGLNRLEKTPCGFCFVEFVAHAGAVAAVETLSGAKLDGRNIRVDLDPGFESGREFGKGRTGGQVRLTL